MQISRLVLLGGLLAFLAGCATTAPTQPQTDVEFKQSMADAEKTFEQKGADSAVPQFEAIAQRNPTRGEPWSYIAKIRFDEQKYGEAIVAADEALNRDPQDFIAKSVRAVGGLRVALQSLSDLRSDQLLAGNAHTDAVALAAAMRETLGQDVLFPEGQKPKRAPRRPQPAPAAPAAPSANTAAPAAASADGGAAPKPAQPAQPAAPAVKPPTAGGADSRAPNPFGMLKP